VDLRSNRYASSARNFEWNEPVVRLSTLRVSRMTHSPLYAGDAGERGVPFGEWRNFPNRPSPQPSPLTTGEREFPFLRIPKRVNLRLDCAYCLVCFE